MHILRLPMLTRPRRGWGAGLHGGLVSLAEAIALSANEEAQTMDVERLPASWPLHSICNSRKDCHCCT